MVQNHLQWFQTEDPIISKRHHSFHLSHHLSKPFSHVVIGKKSMHETSSRRQFTSFSYLSGKLRGVFHRDHRDTIICEEDEEHFVCKRNIYDIIRHSEENAHTFKNFDHLARFSMTLAPNVANSTEKYAPSKEQRWCTNCSKCFQRGLSRYDQYCGLDCKTAHRMRQIA